MASDRTKTDRLATSALGDGLMDYAGVARTLGVSRSTVRRWAYAGKLRPDFRLGNVIRFSLATVARFVMKNGGCVMQSNVIAPTECCNSSGGGRE